jgi:hypothetical protein
MLIVLVFDGRRSDAAAHRVPADASLSSLAGRPQRRGGHDRSHAMKG